MNSDLRNPNISLPKLSVLDSEMAYREAGLRDASVALFLHGNPTSSFIWRNILPLVAPVAHFSAPDFIGFGQSGKPNIAYRFEDPCALSRRLHREGGDWLSLPRPGLGNDARLSPRGTPPDFVRGLAFMEFIRPIPTWKEFARGSKDLEIFLKFRTPGEGEKLILEDNAFVERVLPSGVRRKLTEEEMAVYRAPFPTYQSRRPTWRFPNELPIVGRPADVYAAMERAHAALAVSTYRKLIFSADPGALVSPAVAEEFARRLKDCRLIKLGDGVHFLQEDHPATIGRSVAAFIGEIKARNAKTAA